MKIPPMPKIQISKAEAARLGAVAVVSAAAGLAIAPGGKPEPAPDTRDAGFEAAPIRSATPPACADLTPPEARACCELATSFPGCRVDSPLACVVALRGAAARIECITKAKDEGEVRKCAVVCP